MGTVTQHEIMGSEIGKTNFPEAESENASLASPQRNEKGHFAKGWKGGPGRPRGAMSPAGRFRQTLTEEHGEELLALAMTAVRSGNANSLLGTMMQFVVGQAKAELAPIVLPEATEGTYEERTEAISRAMLDGTISPDAAKVAIEQLKATEEAKQLRELGEELRSLKARLINGTATRIE